MSVGYICMFFAVIYALIYSVSKDTKRYFLLLISNLLLIAYFIIGELK